MMRAVLIATLMCGLLGGCNTAPRPDPRGALTRSAIDASPRPVILAEVEGPGMVATLVPESVSGNVVTWRTAERQTLSFRDGILIETRGLGDDLMRAQSAEVLSALLGGVPHYDRSLTHLDGEGRPVARSLRCTMGRAQPQTITIFDVAFPTVLRIETCDADGRSIENRYWRDADGTMRRSVQWTGGQAGSVTTERLSR